MASVTVHARVYVCTRACMCVYVRVGVRMCAYVRVCVYSVYIWCVYVCVCVCVRVALFQSHSFSLLHPLPLSPSLPPSPLFRKVGGGIKDCRVVSNRKFD